MILKSVWTLILLYCLSSILFESKFDALGEEQKNVGIFEDQKIVPKNKTTFFDDEKVIFKSEGSSIELKSLSLAQAKASPSKNTSQEIEDSEERKEISINNIINVIHSCVEWIFTIILSILSGMVLDLSCARDIFCNKKRSLVIAVFCRFVIAPMLSFCVGGFFIFPESYIFQVILFALGTNLIGYLGVCWTSFLGGNVNLSIIITVMNPIIYLGVGLFLVQSKTIHPSEDKLMGFEYYIMPATIIIAFIIGWRLQIYSVNLKEKASKRAHYFWKSYFISYILLSFLSDLDAMPISLTLAGMILSTLAYFIGWMLAWAFRLPYEDRIAIAVESTIVNIVRLFTSVPMVIQIFVNKIRKKCQNHDTEDDSNSIRYSRDQNI